jgi:DNA-binding response OmpR family regulator
VIVIVSSHSSERTAFAALCASRGWVSLECESLRALRRTLREAPPRVVLTRQRLDDGYSDDIIATLGGAGLLPATKVIVLLDATVSSAQEARQISLGADVVHRDPVRTDVLLEYIAKFRVCSASGGAPHRNGRRESFSFLGGVIQTMERTVHYRGRTAPLSPREVELAEILASAGGQVVTYPMLYSDILGRKFRGDTSNMRVLLGKLNAAVRRVGLQLRRHVQVIPKTGYRYRPTLPRQVR